MTPSTASSWGWSIIEGGYQPMQPVADFLNLPVDQINFIFCNLVAIVLGQFTKRLCKPGGRCSPELRMGIELFLGILCCYFCFGYQVSWLFIQSGVAYILLLTLPRSKSAAAVTAWSMAYLSFTHMYRVYTNYGEFTLDVSGPVMVQTQRLCSIAYNLHDGYLMSRSDSSVQVASHRAHAIRDMPNLLNFWSYMLYFHGVLGGPWVQYTDYMEYIHGYPGCHKVPSSDPVMARVIGYSIMHGLLTVFVYPRFPFPAVVGADFQSSSLLYKWSYVTVASVLLRQRYYFGWSVCQAAALSSGLGYNAHYGDWSMVNNYNVGNVELGGNLKAIIDNWNMSSQKWLRFLVYERAPRSFRTLLVFVFSAVWHGFYPGYYFMFLTLSLFTLCARKFRRTVRPHFQSSPRLQRSYNAVTTVITSVSLNYGFAPFSLLTVQLSWMFWKQFYLAPHLIAMATIVILMKIEPIMWEVRLTVRKLMDSGGGGLGHTLFQRNVAD